MQRIDIRMLGTFAVTVDDRTVGADAFAQRRGADLVKVLALAEGHRLTREAAIDALWPHLGADAGLANLHKAAHHARRALGAPGAVVLRRGWVELAPEAEVRTDVERFEAGDDDAYGGELLPDDRYETWTLEARERLRDRRIALLRRRGGWDELLEEDPADLEAHRALMRRHAEAGDLAAVARQFRTLRDELARLGLRPDEASVALHRELCAGPPVQAVPVTRGPLVGRADELAVVSGALDDTLAGAGHSVLVVGDAGMGKTRLADALVALGAQRGAHVLRATARETEGRTPYRPLAEALEPLLAERPDLLASLTAPVQRVLGLLSPVSITRASGTASGADVLTAVERLLTLAAQERAVVLVVEDLHVSDEATLRVLHYLASVARRERLLLVLTLRPDEGGALVEALRRALQEQGAREVRLGALPDPGLRRLVQRAAPQPLGEAAIDAVVTAAHGNPFFAEELARGADAAGPRSPAPGIEAVLDARIGALAAAAPDLVAVLAVLDDGCTTEDVADVAGVPVAAAATQLQAALRTGTLEAMSGDRWRFRHPLLRGAAQRRVADADLQAAHRHAAARLAQRDAAPERVALHLVAGGRPEGAVPLLREAAGAAAAVGAFVDGERWAELALEHAPPADRPALLELLGDLRHGTGDARAAATFAAARAVAAPEDAPRLRRKEARAYLALGDIAAAGSMVDAIDDGPQDAPETLFLRGLVAWYRGDYAGARRYAEEVAVLAPEADAPYDLQAMVAHSEGRWERAMEAQLADVWHVPQLAGRVLDAYLCVTEYVLNGGDPATTMLRFAGELHEQARTAGARRGEAFAATVLGEAHLLAGDPHTAAQVLGDAVRLSRAVNATAGESLARTRLGQALVALGRRPEARAELEEAIEIAHASTLPGHLLFLNHAALIETARDPEEAMVLVDGAEALLDPQPACRFCPAEYHVAAARACADAGELERGWAFLERAEASAALWRAGPRRAAVAEARGRLLQAAGNDADAEVALLRAASGYAAVGHALREDRVRDLLAAPGKV